MSKTPKTYPLTVPNLADYYCTARVLTEVITLEDEQRKVKYLSPFAKAPSVAVQVSGVMFIAYVLATKAKQKHSEVDVPTTCYLTIWHDAPETRHGDLGRDQQKYVVINEDKSRKDMFSSVSWGPEVINLIERFEETGTDINTKLAKDADALYVLYTIKALVAKGAYVNKPDMRIQKTLLRMKTDEGRELGAQMAKLSSKEMWTFLRKEAGITTVGASKPPKEAIATIMAIAWALSELANKEALFFTLFQVLMGIKNTQDKVVLDLITDSTQLYLLLVAKRTAMITNKMTTDYSKITAKLQTKEGKVLGKAMSEIDLYEWWQLLMGYAVLNAEGRIEMNKQ